MPLAIPSTPVKDLDQPCRLYLRAQGARQIARDFYAGWQEVKAREREYLIPGRNEDNELYARRLLSTSVDPFAEIAIDTRMGIILRRPVQREWIPALDILRGDVDGSGRNEHSFWRDTIRSAQVGGMDWLFAYKVGAPPGPDGKVPIISRAQEREANLRPYIEHLVGEQVKRWGPETGAVRWAVIERELTPEEMDADAPWFQTGKPKRVWQLVTDTSIAWFEKRGEGFILWDKIPPVEHAVGRCPMTRVYGERVSDGHGRSVFHTSLSHILAHYNLGSMADHYLQVSGHVIPWGKGAHAPAEKNAEAGGAQRIVLDVTQGLWFPQGPGDPEPALHYLETSGSAYGITANRLEHYERRIYADLLRRMMNASRQVASSDTQREDKESLNGSLTAFVYGCESAEKEAADNAARWLGDYSDSSVITYDKDFSRETVGAEFLNAIGALTEPRTRPIFDTETAREIIVAAQAIPEAIDLTEVNQRIDAEMRQPGGGDTGEPGRGGIDTAPGA